MQVRERSMVAALVVLLAASRAGAQEEPPRAPPIRIELAVGQVCSIPSADVRSFSDSGSLLELSIDEARGKIDLRLARPGTAVLVVVLTTGKQRTYELVARPQ